MSYALRDYAREHFSHIADRKERDHEAEVALVHEFFGRKAEGYFVDVGANDPKEFSQTWLLEQKGWTGLLVEPMPAMCERLRAERPKSRVVQAACTGPGHPPEADFFISSDHAQSTLVPDQLDYATKVRQVIKVPLVTLDRVLQDAGVSEIPGVPGVDLLSIDVEGAQLEVLAGLDLARWQPRLLLIEDHLVNLRTHRLLKSKGYRLVKRTGLNNWYVPVGDSFTMTSISERLKLWRKVVLGTPWRAWRARWRIRAQRRKSRPSTG